MPKITLNNAEIYYETAGKGQMVLFIHGLGSSVRDWETQIPVFSKSFQTVAFDLRGHGQSQKPQGPYSMSLFASDAAGLIKSLGGAPVHVVGISLGGMVAFQLAVNHPELVKSLTIVNSGPEVVVRTLKDRWQVFLRFAIVRLLGMRKMGEVLSKRLFPKPEQSGLRDTFVERWAENDTRAYLDTLRAIVGWSVANCMQNIHLPILVITADGDYTPVSAKEEFVSKIPQAELVVITGSHHATPVDSPEKFNEIALSFLLKR